MCYSSVQIKEFVLMDPVMVRLYVNGRDSELLVLILHSHCLVVFKL